MTTEVKVHVGDTLTEMGDRFVEAWHRAESGQLTEARPEYHLSFESFATLASVMTSKRLELLREVHRRPARSVRALAQALGRDYRRVHDDVEALSSAGLLDRGPDGLRAEYDTVRIETRIAL